MAVCRQTCCGRWLVLLGMVTVTGCREEYAGKPAGEADAPAPRTMLTVFAAASLSDAFGEVGRSFEEAYPGVTIAFNFAGSQQLAQQLALGAPADVFASADPVQMEAAVQAGRVDAGASRVFVRNRLTVVVPEGNPADVGALRDLARPGVKLVLAAEAVPAGRYAFAVLGRASREKVFGPGFRQRVLRNVVSYEQNVRVVLTKVSLGEADAGIVYTSDLESRGAARVERVEIPDPLNERAAYPVAPVADGLHALQAADFVNFVLSAQGQAILTRYGFLPAGTA